MWREIVSTLLAFRRSKFGDMAADFAAMSQIGLDEVAFSRPPDDNTVSRDRGR